jgi:hypothetical protein
MQSRRDYWLLGGICLCYAIMITPLIISFFYPHIAQVAQYHLLAEVYVLVIILSAIVGTILIRLLVSRVRSKSNIEITRLDRWLRRGAYFFFSVTFSPFAVFLFFPQLLNDTQFRDVYSSIVISSFIMLLILLMLIGARGVFMIRRAIQRYRNDVPSPGAGNEAANAPDSSR